MDCTQDDQVRLLRWAAARERASPQGASDATDLDVAAELEWTEEKAQSMLAALRTRGDLRVKDVLLDGGSRYSMASIALTEQGRDRLVACDGASGRGSLLARLGRLVPRRS